MASPQKEKGYTSIANEILHALMGCKLLNYEMRVVICVVRKTYGWNKKIDWVSNSQISEVTGIAKPNVTRTINTLIAKKILQKDGKKIGLQKDWERWKVEWYVDKKVISRDNTVISPDNKKLSHQIPTKERKETIQKQLAKTSFADNKNDMSFNKKGDDYEEGFIDLDGDGSLLEEKKPQTKKYPNAPLVRKVFLAETGKNPKNWKINKTQLLACENLYTERGLKTIQNALRWYKEHKDMEYCPQISSPYDLDSKWTKLSAFKKQYGNT